MFAHVAGFFCLRFGPGLLTRDRYDLTNRFLVPPRCLPLGKICFVMLQAPGKYQEGVACQQDPKCDPRHKNNRPREAD